MEEKTPNLDPIVTELRRLLAEATAGPWESVTILPSGKRQTKDGGWEGWSESEWRNINGPPQTISDAMLCRRAFTHRQDADLIAMARNHLPALLDELERLKARVEELEEDILSSGGLW